MKYLISLLCTALWSTAVLADAPHAKLPGNLAVHIAQIHYEHPTRLLHPYLDVWHMTGPLAQKVALAELNKRFENVQWCNQAKNATVVLLLEPHMFYNPQLKVFHAEFIAKVYKPSAETISSGSAFVNIKKQAQQIGDLNVNPKFYMEKAYVKAMDKVIQELEKNQTFIDSLYTTQVRQAETICPVLDDLPLSKLYY